MCPRPADPLAHDSLLEAARTEFALRGLEGARLEDITRRAGLSKGAFYLHFESKEDAYRQLLERFFGVLEELAHRHDENESAFVQAYGKLTSEDVAQDTERFRKALELECSCDAELLETLWRNRKILAILDSAGGSRYLPIVERFRRRMADFVVKSAFSEKAATCLRPDVDRSAVADLICGAYESFARRMMHLRQKPNLVAWARTVLLVVRSGAFVPAPAPAPARSDVPGREGSPPGSDPSGSKRRPRRKTPGRRVQDD